MPNDFKIMHGPVNIPPSAQQEASDPTPAYSNIYNAAMGASNQFGGSSNIEDLIMAVQFERGDILDQQISDQMKDVEKRNKWLQDANAAMNALRNARPNDTTSKVNPYNVEFTNSDGQQESVGQWAYDNGVSSGQAWSDQTQAQVDQSLQSMKSAVDTANSTSQMDMVRLQGLMDKRSQAYDMISNTLQKTDKGTSDVIDKLGQ
ncbi:hypothetical protein JMJ56_18645 [Belnapia sp. T18]|uniref:Uncharacterized protein n=1 Tax=Belnapia arida TaxID=2804533 RepID=A0ABS1U5T0_9PROT|nr:hypothetical protein [Belnapia arida]MBL6080044.1 hypothetical protein [Belnapia arida]